MSGEAQSKPLWKRWWVWVLAVIVLGAMSRMGGGGGAAVSSGSPSIEQEVKKPELVVTATAYFNDYEGNEVAADEKYKGKLIEISGTVAEVRKTLGSYFIDLESPNQFLHIACEMSSQDGLASVAKGSSVTIIGQGAGKVMSPRLDECVVKR